MDMAVHLSETICQHIKKPSISSGSVISVPTDKFNLDLLQVFDDCEDKEGKREYLEDERDMLKGSLKKDGIADKKKVKSALMSVWDKIISRSNTIKRLNTIGRRVYERLIQKILPFDFEEQIDILSTEECKSLEDKLSEHFEKKIKESMRGRIQARIEQNYD